MPNIEMKAPYPDLSRARETALRLGGEFLWKDEQIDTYFHTREGKLKLRESGRNGAELLPYIKGGQGELLRSDYAQIPVANPALTRGLLDRLLGRRNQVRKIREVFLLGNVRVHLDEVVDLGSFLEFEAVFEDDTPQAQERESRKVAELMREFGLSASDLFTGSYPDLLAAKSQVALAAQP